MRLAVLKNNLTRTTPILLVVLLLLVLAFFSGSPSTRKAPSGQKTFGSKIQGEQESNSADQSQPGDSSEDGNSANDQTSTSTKVSISVNSNATNGETDHSANVEITTNGQTQNLTDALDKCINEGEVDIKDHGNKLECEYKDGALEIDWSSKNNQSQDNDIENNNKVDWHSSSH